MIARPELEREAAVDDHPKVVVIIVNQSAAPPLGTRALQAAQRVAGVGGRRVPSRAGAAVGAGGSPAPAWPGVRTVTECSLRLSATCPGCSRAHERQAEQPEPLAVLSHPGQHLRGLVEGRSDQCLGRGTRSTIHRISDPDRTHRSVASGPRLLSRNSELTK